MKLIVGLGNVGSDYTDTRHNVGFMVVQRLAARHRVRWSRQGGALCGQWRLGATVMKLLLPQTMMNRSGEALAVRRTDPGACLIVLDDVNLPLGTLRLRPHGGDGGHHGLASCIDVLGTDDVPRLRIGVGAQPTEPAPSSLARTCRARPLPKDLTEFVLSPFEQEERPVLDRAMGKAVDACEVWAREGMRGAMDRMSTGR